MFGKLNLKSKIFILATAVVLASFVAVVLIVTRQSVEMVKADAIALARETAEKYGNEIKAELQGARVTSETLAVVFETLKDHQVTDRGLMNDILKRALVQKGGITAFCIGYEPNALDGKDAEYAGQKPEYDATGRFAPYWNKVGDSIQVQPLHDIDRADWWTVPKRTRQECLTDPYPYDVQGKTVMLASMVFPILHRGEFIGIISTDIVLDKLQEMVSRVDARESGGFTAIFSNSGVLAAHPDKTCLGKDIRQTLLYGLLKTRPEKTEALLARANAWLHRQPEQPASGEAGRADDSTATGRSELIAFREKLARWSAGPAAAPPPWPEIPPDLASDLLSVDAELAGQARQVAEAIKSGRQYSLTWGGYYTVFLPIRLSQATSPWSVAVNLPLSRVLAPAQRIRNYVAGVSLVSIVVIAFVLYLVARSVAGPVLVLAETAKALGEGRFAVEIPLADNRGELGVLAGAFKVMAAKIRDQVSTLQNNARELEEKNNDLNGLNEMLVAAKEQAEESSRVKSLFLSNMSHEIRTPLNAVIGMSSIGKSAGGVDKKDYAFHKIEDASVHLLGVVNDILDMSKIEADKLELTSRDFRFERMLRKAVNFITFRVEEKKQDLHVSIDRNIPERLSGDDQRLAQVLTNLLSNAVKFTPESGFIQLSARLLEEKDGWCALRFEVADTGIGISLEQQGRLFQAFQQVDGSSTRGFGGTGLGLAISKHIVHQMDGEIWVESESGAGATFIFTVRLRRSKAERPKSLNPGVNWKNIRILAVDDEPEVREYFRETAQGLGIVCDAVSSGFEALALLEKGLRYDIYFIDWQMPGMNGIELSRAIRQSGGRAAERPDPLRPAQQRPEGEDFVVTIISSVEWGVIAEEAKAAGVGRFLPKPVFRSDIADCINECLGLTDLPEENELPVSETDFAGLRVLLAEDVAINREICLALLEPSGLLIDCVENGDEALRRFDENQELYDLILMDVQMPGMDGLEATRRIRALGTPWAVSIPIVAMTANVFSEDVEKCLAAGMNDHLGKPLDMELVFDKLRRYLVRKGWRDRTRVGRRQWCRL